MDIIGGKYVFEPVMLGGKKHDKSDYAHDQDFVVKVADKNHPITQGISDCKIHDETYKNYYTLPDVHVLLTTDFPTNDPEIAWVTPDMEKALFFIYCWGMTPKPGLIRIIQSCFLMEYGGQQEKVSKMK